MPLFGEDTGFGDDPIERPSYRKPTRVKNDLRIISKVIYKLKKSWGQPLTVYFETASTTDLATGNKTVTKASVFIRRAVILPSIFHRTFTQDIGYLKANSNFTYGGVFSESTRQIIIDRKDLPHDFEIRPSDQYYIVYDNRRFNLKEVQEYDAKLAYFITMIGVSSQAKGDAFTMVARNQLTPTDVAGGTT